MVILFFAHNKFDFLTSSSLEILSSFDSSVFLVKISIKASSMTYKLPFKRLKGNGLSYNTYLRLVTIRILALATPH